jgi:hypothetical protein
MVQFLQWLRITTMSVTSFIYLYLIRHSNGAHGDVSTIVRDQDIYKQDWIGLKTLVCHSPTLFNAAIYFACFIG